MDPITNPTKTETPRSENESQPQPINSLFFTTTKNHHQSPAVVVVTYKECLKNHAASLGGHALDGCGEFMPSPTTAATTDPTSLKCAACGCHRNFHRHYHQSSSATTTHFIDFHHHRHPPVGRHSLSPPPLSTSHVLLPAPLRTNQPPADNRNGRGRMEEKYSSGRKRYRTKFSEQQKEKMLGLAERIDWKMRRCDNEMVDDFCNEIGIDKSVVKVWMHNNKSALRKNSTSTSGSGRVNFDNNVNNNSSHSPHQNDIGAQFLLSNNGSSSSS